MGSKMGRLAWMTAFLASLHTFDDGTFGAWCDDVDGCVDGFDAFVFVHHVRLIF